MFYIYILYSSSSNKYYVGYNNDYIRRIFEHNSSERNTFTSKHRPWMLKVVFECGSSEAVAISIERFIKNQKSRKLIERIISGGQLDGILAQLVRISHMD